MSAVSALAEHCSGAENNAADVSRLENGRLADYLTLCRPRIAVMSAAAAAAGYTLTATQGVDWIHLAFVLTGIVSLVASASILNQVLESETDLLMKRTEKRPLATGRISVAEGWLIGLLALLVGFVVLLKFANVLTAMAGVLTAVVYVAIYTPMKRWSPLCTTVGAIPGAMPPVLGWFAAGGAPDLGALSLFALFFVWQFPHFLAIAWIYRDQYRQAGLKMLPGEEDGGRRAGLIALIYAAAFVPVSVMPRFAGLSGAGYVASAMVLSLGYLWLTLRFTKERTDERARQLMLGSLLCRPALLISLVFDYVRLTS
ncbi:MAG: heme o synthase [Planctomyces sp.]